MAAKTPPPTPTPTLYNVRTHFGADVVIGVGLDVAKSEQARLNAEARVDGKITEGGSDVFNSMHDGECVVHEVVDPLTGLVVV